MQVFDRKFDIQEYIEKRTLEIENLENRRMFKEVLTKMFSELYNGVEQEYRLLEERVFSEVPLLEIPDIYTNIIPRRAYDVTDEFLRPVRQADLEEVAVDFEKLQQALLANEPYYLYMVFLKSDFSQTQRFAVSDRMFSGFIRTKYNKYVAQFQVKKNEYYWQKIEALYPIFQTNYILWRSVCAPYFLKLFDVYLISVESWNEIEEIVEIEVDFAEFKDGVCYDHVPLWNIEETRLLTSAYPEPMVDRMQYEHRVFRHKFVESERYLIANQDIDIYNIRWQNGDLVINCMVEDPVEWIIYRFRKKSDNDYVNRCMTNAQNESFAVRLRAKFQHGIKTKLDLQQWLASFYYTGDFKFIDSTLLRPDVPRDTYSLDSFIKDELRIDTDKQIMMLTFEATDEKFYLNADLMSFLVSSVQAYFPAYECCGRLLPKGE